MKYVTLEEVYFQLGLTEYTEEEKIDDPVLVQIDNQIELMEKAVINSIESHINDSLDNYLEDSEEIELQADLKLAVLATLKHRYIHRGLTSHNKELVIPYGLEWMLSPYKRYNW